MLATKAASTLLEEAPPPPVVAEPATIGGGPQALVEEGEGDDMASARGILLGATLGAASLTTLGLLGWWLL